MERHLAVILAADVVGYSALMERDETGTYEQLTVRRKELFEPEIARHHGRIFKLMGDGLLAEFASVVEAVECAVALQRGLAERNQEFPQNQQIVARIGINLGEVIVDGTDRYGEGVNIAARLQQLADPGGICVSGKVAKEVEKKLAFGFEPMGEQKVKNIAEPVSVFRVKTDGLSARRPSMLPPMRQLSSLVMGSLLIVAGVLYAYLHWKDPSALPLPDKPSVAILPFDNLSGDERLGRLADGMVADITNNLSRFSELFVIARNSAFTYQGKRVDVRQVGRELGVRYLIVGTVQGDANQLKVATQLIDASTGLQVWSEQFDRPLKDLFAVQADITERVVSTLASTRGVVQQAVLSDARKRAPQDLEVYDLYLIGDDLRRHFTEVDNDKAIQTLQRAIAKEPDFEPAWVILALCYWNRVDNVWGDIPDDMDQWLKAANRAVALDPGDAMAHVALALRFEFANEFAPALREFNLAYEANPNHALMLSLTGGNLPFLEQSDRPVAYVERAMRLNPRYRPFISHMSKLAYYYAHQYDKTISEIHLRDDLLYFDYMYLALSHAQLGQQSEAQKAAADLLKIRPELSAELYLAEAEFAPAAQTNRQLFLDGWKKAGLPYCATVEQLSHHPGFVRLSECAGSASDSAKPIQQ